MAHWARPPPQRPGKLPLGTATQRPALLRHAAHLHAPYLPLCRVPLQAALIVPLIIGLVFLQRVYSAGAIVVRAREAAERKPALTVVGDVLSGLQTLQAFGKQGLVETQMRAAVRRHSAWYNAFNGCECRRFRVAPRLLASLVIPPPRVISRLRWLAAAATLPARPPTPAHRPLAPFVCVQQGACCLRTGCRHLLAGLLYQCGHLWADCLLCQHSDGPDVPAEPRIPRPAGTVQHLSIVR